MHRDAMLAELWVRMTSNFGHRWVSQYGAKPAGVDAQEWGCAIDGLSLEQIGQGMHAVRCSGDDWPPGAPAFRRLCLAIPSLAQVRMELRPGAPSVSAFTRMVWQLIDPWRFRHADDRVATVMLRDAYEIAERCVLSGQALPADPVALVERESRVPSAANPEVVRAVVERMRGVLA